MIINTDYSNAFWNDVVVNLRDTISPEFAPVPVYVSPVFQESGNLGIRIWGESSSTIDYMQSGWSRSFDVTIALYMIKENPDEVFFKQFYQDAERLYQLLFDNKFIGANGTNNGFIDGVVSELIINEIEKDEEDINGLHVAKFNYQCIVQRSD